MNSSNFSGWSFDWQVSDLRSFASSVVGMCCDYGTESLLSEAPGFVTSNLDRHIQRLNVPETKRIPLQSWCLLGAALSFAKHYSPFEGSIPADPANPGQVDLAVQRALKEKTTASSTSAFSKPSCGFSSVLRWRGRRCFCCLCSGARAACPTCCAGGA